VNTRKFGTLEILCLNFGKIFNFIHIFYFYLLLENEKYIYKKFWSKSKIWRKIEIVWSKSKFWRKSKLFGQNRNFGKKIEIFWSKSKFSSEMELLIKNVNPKKLELKTYSSRKKVRFRKTCLELRYLKKFRNSILHVSRARFKIWPPSPNGLFQEAKKIDLISNLVLIKLYRGQIMGKFIR